MGRDYYLLNLHQKKVSKDGKARLHIVELEPKDNTSSGAVCIEIKGKTKHCRINELKWEDIIIAPLNHIEDLEQIIGKDNIKPCDYCLKNRMHQ